MRSLFSLPGIVSGLIASILFLYFIEPMFTWTWNFISGFSGGVYSDYVNSIYRSAALGHRNHVDLAIFAVIISILLGFFSPTILYVLFMINKTDDENRRRVEYIDKVLKLPLMKGFVLLSIFGFLCSAFLIVANFYFDLQLYTSFEQRMSALGPALTPKEGLELRARWATMESQDDYLSIQTRMQSIAAQRGINLPAPLLE